jgi:hypothetical protein
MRVSNATITLYICNESAEGDLSKKARKKERNCRFLS